MPHPQIDAEHHSGTDTRDEAEKNADIDPKRSSASDIQYSLDEGLSASGTDDCVPVKIELAALKPMVMGLIEAFAKMNLDIESDSKFIDKPAVAGVDGQAKVNDMVDAPVLTANPEKLNRDIPKPETRNTLVDVGAMSCEPARNETEFDVIKPPKPSVDASREFAEGPGTEFQSGDSRYPPQVEVAEHYYDSDDDDDDQELTIQQILDLS